ncbi:hypothetical protein V6N13_059832 [Hibiscus sabdariffa]|uniref:Uncharacterized protein n=1 Tax=Hibiscus sabdariffa TaxID=183260 RepID=A0ABR2GBS5_9ROSI
MKQTPYPVEQQLSPTPPVYTVRLTSFRSPPSLVPQLCPMSIVTSTYSFAPPLMNQPHILIRQPSRTRLHVPRDPHPNPPQSN